MKAKSRIVVDGADAFHPFYLGKMVPVIPQPLNPALKKRFTEITKETL